MATAMWLTPVSFYDSSSQFESQASTALGLCVRPYVLAWTLHATSSLRLQWRLGWSQAALQLQCATPVRVTSLVGAWALCEAKVLVVHKNNDNEHNRH